jgi:uncharacterized protein (TIGR02996 family)
MLLEHDDGSLQDIIAHPDDDALRLISAEWFKNTGIPSFAAHAEYICLKCEIDRLWSMGRTRLSWAEPSESD